MEYLQRLLMIRLLWLLVIMLAVGNGCNGCLEKERIALLQLKDSINFPNGTWLPSWEEDDNTGCCQWEGVECDFTTRQVIKLSLNSTRLIWNRRYYFWETDVPCWHLNVSILLPFKSLRSLILSQNNLCGFIINEGLKEESGILEKLEVLDLSYQQLDNSVWSFLRGLSSIKALYLAEAIYGADSKGLGIISNLSNLEDVDLNYNLLGSRILPYLNKLSNLKILNLALNDLNGSIPSNSIEGHEILSNFSNLEDIYLEDNNLDSSILQYLNKLSNLKILNLALNSLDGSISMKEFEGLNNLKELNLRLNDIAYIKALNRSQEESGILNKLEVLDLSQNNFNDTVWSFLGDLSSIKTVYLSYNRGLLGAIHDMTNLSSIENLFMNRVMLDDDFLQKIRVMTSIQVLSLRDCGLTRVLPLKEGLCKLKTLRELDIGGIGFGETLPWCLANLTSLRLLDLTYNNFSGNIAQSPLINLTSLEYLAISNNNFTVPISFKSFFNHSKLQFIRSIKNKLLKEEDFPARSPSFQLLELLLSDSEHDGKACSIPGFLYHQHDLLWLQLSRTNFTGKFPYWLLENNTRLERLDLSYNSLSGLSFPSRPMKNFLAMDISNNHFEGFLPWTIASSFPGLQVLNLSTNSFEGNIPSSFGDMTALKLLDLSHNKLFGEIPVHLAIGCCLLESLRLSNNKLEGPVLPRQHNLTLLKVLYANNNNFTEILPNLSWSSLEVLDVSGNQLVGKIPRFSGNTPLQVLDLAGNQHEGPIPIEFCQLNNLIWLDLSSNKVNGTVPSCFSSLPNLVNILLSKNSLDGPFPIAFQNSSYSLKVLDLSYNQFSGNIPTWIANFSSLAILLLQGNHFEGNIPKELCLLSELTLIDLSFNSLFGNIPHCISKLEFKGIAEEPEVWFPIRRADFSLPTVQFTLASQLSLIPPRPEGSSIIVGLPKEVKFVTKGRSLPYKGIILHLFSGINLSHNNLTGPIPPEIGNLSNIKVLNYSHNHLTGTIPSTFSKLENIETLDLSYNHLNGKIPSQLTELNQLADFNLSYNNLSGRTPPRTAQFGTFDSSSYFGNPLLCGEPLPRMCNPTESPPSTPEAVANDNEEDSGFMDWYVFYMSFAGSYVTVVLAIVAILVINPYWRRAWFHLVEVFLTSCYYFIVDNLVGRRWCFYWR